MSIPTGSTEVTALKISARHLYEAIVRLAVAVGDEIPERTVAEMMDMDTCVVDLLTKWKDAHDGLWSIRP